MDVPQQALAYETSLAASPLQEMAQSLSALHEGGVPCPSNQPGEMKLAQKLFSSLLASLTGHTWCGCCQEHV